MRFSRRHKAEKDGLDRAIGSTEGWIEEGFKKVKFKRLSPSGSLRMLDFPPQTFKHYTHSGFEEKPPHLWLKGMIRRVPH